MIYIEFLVTKILENILFNALQRFIFTYITMKNKALIISQKEGDIFNPDNIYHQFGFWLQWVSGQLSFGFQSPGQQKVRSKYII